MIEEEFIIMEKKADAVVKTEEVKTTAEEGKDTVLAAEEAAPAKPRAKRGPKPGPRTGKKADKAELKPGVVLQFQGSETTVEEAVEKIKSQFVSEGHRVSTIKDLRVYLKPEESAAYYVINQKFAGRIDLF